MVCLTAATCGKARLLRHVCVCLVNDLVEKSDAQVNLGAVFMLLSVLRTGSDAVCYVCPCLRVLMLCCCIYCLFVVVPPLLLKFPLELGDTLRVLLFTCL